MYELTNFKNTNKQVKSEYQFNLIDRQGSLFREKESTIKD